MTKHEARRNFLVGVTFLGSLGVLGAVTLEWDELPFLREAMALQVRFPKTDQLKAGDDVMVLGHRIGQIESVRFAPAVGEESPILVVCAIDARFPIEKTATFAIRSAGALGGRYLEIDPDGEEGVEVRPPEGDVYYGRSSGDLFAQLESLVEKNEGRINDILEGLREVVTDLRTGEGLLQKLMQDPQMAEDAREILKNIREATEALKDSTGTAGALIFDPETKQKTLDIVENFREFSTTLNDEESVIGYLTRNEEAKKELEATVSDLREVIGSIREGDGVAARLLNDDELANRLEETVADLQETLNKINSGHGTLGQLVNNRQAWDELVRILIEARETLEDLREQAPISTFVNAIFSIF